MLASTVLSSRDGFRPSAACAADGDTSHHESAAARRAGSAAAGTYPPARLRGKVLWVASKRIGVAFRLSDDDHSDDTGGPNSCRGARPTTLNRFRTSACARDPRRAKASISV